MCVCFTALCTYGVLLFEKRIFTCIIVFKTNNSKIGSYKYFITVQIQKLKLTDVIFVTYIPRDCDLFVDSQK